MIDMTAYRIDAVGPPWRYVLRKDGEPVFVSPEICTTRGDAVRRGIIDRPRLVASLEHQQGTSLTKRAVKPTAGHASQNRE
jgi:hypothetical protein